MTKILGAQILATYICSRVRGTFRRIRQRATSTFELLSSRHSTFLVVATRSMTRYGRPPTLWTGSPRKACPSRAWCSTGCTPQRWRSRRNERCRWPRTSREPQPYWRWRHYAVTALMRTIETETRMMERFAAARPAVAQTQVQSLPTDVTDLAALRRVGALLSDKD